MTILNLAVLLWLTSASAFRYNYVDPRIYSFAFIDAKPVGYFDGESLVGVHVELMKEICCRAAKRCVAALVNFDDCMNRNVMSPVLDNRWHDVCLILGNIPRRSATFAFSDINFHSEPGPGLIARKDSNITLDDLRNPRNNIKVAFLGNKGMTTSRNLESFRKEFFVQPGNIVPVDAGGPKESVDRLVQIVNAECIADGETVGLVILGLVDPDDDFKLLKVLPDPAVDISMMVRKDEQGILDWWDYTLKRFVCSPDYADYCDRMERQFGKNPYCADPKQVDCTDCTISRRVPGCDCPGS